MSHGRKNIAAHPSAGEDEGEDFSSASGVGGYAIGLGLATLLTIAAFLLPVSGLVWAPAIGPALIALAIGQMGVHLAFFLHISTGPGNTNNVLALMFGVMVVVLVIIGSIWIMYHLDHRMMPIAEMTRRMR